MTHESPNKTWNFIKQNWAAIIFIAGLVVTWTNFQNNQSTDQTRLVKLEARMDAEDTSQTQILVQLSQIQSDLTWLKARFK